MDVDEGTAPPRERGWLGPIVALLALVTVTTLSAPRVVVPVGQILLLVAPASAALAVAGWRAGGRLPLALLWTGFAVWVVVQPAGAPGLYADLTRGWGVLLALAFGVAAAAGWGEGFLSKGLFALAAAAGLGLLALALVPDGPPGAARLLSEEIGRRSTLASREWQELSGSPQWIQLVRESPGWEAYGRTVEAQLSALPAIGLRFFPALLALESLAALALGWAVYHRVGRARLGPPLARLRDLRFHEALVWGVVAGLALVALPLTGAARDAGLNLLVFFGVLYAMRGSGVLVWFLDPGRVMTVVLAVFTVLFWPVVVMVSAGVGLGDTWFDWRRAARGRSQRSE